VESLLVRRTTNVYTAGDPIDMVYVVEHGEVKLVVVSPAGRECLLGVGSSGDVVGESVFAGVLRRPETATAMRETLVKRMPRGQFLERLTREGLTECFVAYLAARIAEQDQSIVSLVTERSERRLGDTLLALARKLGSHDAASNALLPVRISHEELAAMIGTTRPRVSTFMQKFRKLDLITASDEQRLIVKERRLADYLERLD
jgi:CRP-like cAMP-binding protein